MSEFQNLENYEMKGVITCSSTAGSGALAFFICFKFLYFL
jgi:hypothetical protein